jgi:tetratricopeptide (TPR) repeat protein
LSGGLVATQKLSTSAAGAPVLTADEEYAEGCDAYRQGDYLKADGCFDRALKVDPENMRFLFASGRTQLALQHPFNAESRFTLAYVQEKEKSRHLKVSSLAIGGAASAAKPAAQIYAVDGRIVAARSYCELLCGHPRAAVEAANEALDRSVGFTTAEVYINRASASMRDANFAQAELDLFEALKRDEQSVPGHYLRARLALLKWQQERITNPNALVPQEAADDIEFVIPKRAVNQGGDAYALVHLEASQIYAALAESPGSLQAKMGREHLRQAVQGGLDKNRVIDSVRDPVFIPRLGMKEVRADAEGLPEYADTAPLIPSSLWTADPIKGWLK